MLAPRGRHHEQQHRADQAVDVEIEERAPERIGARRERPGRARRRASRGSTTVDMSVARPRSVRGLLMQAPVLGVQ